VDRRLVGPQSHSGHGGDEKNSQSLPGIEPWNPDRPARSLVAILTELSQLSESRFMNSLFCVCPLKIVEPTDQFYENW
jgi:hypothetical protein